MVAALALFALVGCRSKEPLAVDRHSPPDSRRVLVVYNTGSLNGEEIAKYYIDKRRIPPVNVVQIDCTADEEVSMDEYEHQILSPIQKNLRNNPNQIDFIVLTKGTPIRLAVEQKYSVDAFVAAMNLKFEPIQKLTETDLKRALNPFFNSKEQFSSKKMGFYLVTRLDGYTAADCKRLVDNSLRAKPEKGTFVFDEADNRKDEAYKPMQDTLQRAAGLLAGKGFGVLRDTTKQFVAPSTPMAGYASWGSNDSAFNLSAYKKLRFKPGALCETFVSTSGRTFLPTTGGQSLIADLIAQGVTGVKGYVSEPYTFALAKPDIMFDRYTDGRNLAESFYAASMFLKWKDVVIGDPLCAPYKK